MGTHDKLWERLHSKPKDFTWQELTSLLKSLGFEVMNGSGSRRKFVHTETKKVISLHEPHPEKIIKMYVIKDVIENLRGLGESHE
ncbi:type II toxin-antitoxin system HicA family toxin [Aeromonas veronii]